MDGVAASMPSYAARFTKIIVKVGGYSWLVYGSRAGARWNSHLVEFIGPYPAPRIINKATLQNIRTEVANSLEMEATSIRPITRDLVLV